MFEIERHGIHRCQTPTKMGHGVFDPSPSASIYLQTLVVHNAMPNSRSCMLLPLFSSPFTAFLVLLHMYMKKLDHGDSVYVSARHSSTTLPTSPAQPNERARTLVLY